jgi:hypothetical protein
VALVALLAAGAAVLVFHAGHGGRVTRDLVSGPWRHQADAVEARFACLSGRVGELVRPGTRVHLGTGPGWELRERLIELVTYAEGLVVDEAEPADLLVDGALERPEAADPGYVAPDARPDPPGTCGGLSLWAVPVGAAPAR